MKLRIFSLSEFVCVCLLFGSLFSIFRSIPTGLADLPEYPSYSSTISFQTWFIRMMNDKKVGLHGLLNSSTWFEEGWNLTSNQYIQAHHRWGLSTYLWGCLIMHSLSQGDQWLYEAKWIVDQYLLHEGQDASNKSSWQLYERQPVGSKRWLWHDTRIWMAMQYLNDYGFSYDLTSRLGTLWSKTAIDNSTDLAWMYDWGYSYSDASYVQNALSFAVPLFSFLHNQGNGNHTSNMTRIYTSLERFRLANHKYKYKISDATESNRYSLISLLNMMIGYKYLPSVFDTTKFQLTLDAFAMDEFGGSSEYDRIVGTAVAILAESIGLTLPEWGKRLIPMYYDYTQSYYQEHWWADRIFFLSRYYMDVWTDLILWALSFCTTYSFTQATPSLQQSSHYVCFKTRVDNQTYFREASDGLLITPIWRSNWLDTRLDDYSEAIDLSPIFNTTTNRWEDTVTYAGNDLTFKFDKYGYDWNVSYAGSPIPWRLISAVQGDVHSTWNLIMPNGTVTDLRSIASGSAIQADTAWALEVRISSVSGIWVLFNTDNSTLVMNKTSSYMWLTSNVKNWEGHFAIDFYVSLDANAWSHVETEIAQALTKLKNGENRINEEPLYPRTQNLIIHSDANISNYEDKITSESKLSFTLTYGGGQASTTYVYVLEKPSSISGATSWSYDSEAKITTINTLHTTSSKEITVNFAEETHDVAITAITPSKTVVGQGYPMQIDVTVQNQGNFTETFNITNYANGTIIQTQTAADLASGDATVIAFKWNTTGIAYGSYTISAVADTIPEEIDTTDNSYTDGAVLVTVAGDVNGDRTVNVLDLSIVSMAYGNFEGEPDYDPEADINEDGIVDMRDLAIVARNLGETQI